MKRQQQDDHKSAARKLDAFLVENRELEQLNARLASFSLFRVLRIEHAEIRHSNVLAWLLTPGETHGLGANFLRRFLSRLLMENQDVTVELTAAQVELMRFDDVEVLREHHNIDILVRSASDKWCLLIENKIRSKEAAGQLVRYVNAVRRETPDLDVIPVLLTLEGDDPSEEGQQADFVPLSHAQVLELLEQMLEQHQKRVPEDAALFLEHYVDTLRRLTMQDSELVNLCKTIYRKHRDAIDLIVEYGAASQVFDACEAAVSEMVESEFLLTSHGRVWFMPTDMAAHLTEVTPGWSHLPKRYPLAWWFYHAKKRESLQICLEVGPVENQDVRQAFLKEAKDAGFKFQAGALTQDRKYTRIVKRSQKLRVTDDGEPDDDFAYIQEVCRTLWGKAWDESRAILPILKRFDWGG